MARNEQSIKDATDLNPKGTNLETKDHVMVNGDMAGKQETFMDSGDCQMSVDDESLECREKRVNKKKRKGTPFSRTEGNRKENDGESLAEGTEVRQACPKYGCLCIVRCIPPIQTSNVL